MLSHQRLQRAAYNSNLARLSSALRFFWGNQSIKKYLALNISLRIKLMQWLKIESVDT
jgi:hypothetical protein